MCSHDVMDTWHIAIGAIGSVPTSCDAAARARRRVEMYQADVFQLAGDVAGALYIVSHEPAASAGALATLRGTHVAARAVAPRGVLLGAALAGGGDDAQCGVYVVVGLR